MVVPNYMALLDLKISFFYHTFTFTFIPLEMDKDWDIYLFI